MRPTYTDVERLSEKLKQIKGRWRSSTVKCLPSTRGPWVWSDTAKPNAVLQLLEERFCRSDVRVDPKLSFSSIRLPFLAFTPGSLLLDVPSTTELSPGHQGYQKTSRTGAPSFDIYAKSQVATSQVPGSWWVLGPEDTHATSPFLPPAPSNLLSQPLLNLLKAEL